MSERGGQILEAMSDATERRIGLEDIDTILTRNEKHGALYRIANVDVFGGDQKIKFAVSTTGSEQAKEWLRR